MDGFHYRVYTILLGGGVFLVLWYLPKSLISDVRNMVSAIRSWRDEAVGSRTTLKRLHRPKVALIAGTLGLTFAVHIAVSIAAPQRYVVFSDDRAQSIFGFLMFLLLIIAPGALVVCSGFLANLLPLRQRVVVTVIEPLVTEPAVRGLDAAIKDKSPHLYTELSVGERLWVDVTAGLREPVSVAKGDLRVI